MTSGFRAIVHIFRQAFFPVSFNFVIVQNIAAFFVVGVVLASGLPAILVDGDDLGNPVEPGKETRDLTGKVDQHVLVFFRFMIEANLDGNIHCFRMQRMWYEGLFFKGPQLLVQGLGLFFGRSVHINLVAFPVNQVNQSTGKSMFVA